MIKKLLGLFLVLVAIVCAAPTADQLSLMGSRYTFDMWLAEFMPHKFLNIEPHNYVERRKIFENNLATIMKHNSNPHASWKMGINQWTAFTAEQVAEISSGTLVPSTSDEPMTSEYQDALNQFTSHTHETGALNLPEKHLWTDVINPVVRSQGQCGSCYAYSSTTISSYHLAIATKNRNPVLFSTQQTVDCHDNSYVPGYGKNCGGTGGCRGATAAIGMYFLSKNGIILEKDYPYVSGNTKEPNPTCEQDGKPRYAAIDGANTLPRHNRTAVLETLYNLGPLSVSVDASTGLHLYESGIFDKCTRDDNTIILNHAVILLGWSKDEKTGQDYYLFQNSWGTAWGENGLFKVVKEDLSKSPIAAINPEPLHGYSCELDANQKRDFAEMFGTGCMGMYSNVAHPKNPRLV